VRQFGFVHDGESQSFKERRLKRQGEYLPQTEATPLSHGVQHELLSDAATDMVWIDRQASNFAQVPPQERQGAAAQDPIARSDENPKLANPLIQILQGAKQHFVPLGVITDQVMNLIDVPHQRRSNRALNFDALSFAHVVGPSCRSTLSTLLVTFPSANSLTIWSFCDTISIDATILESFARRTTAKPRRSTFR